MTTLNQIAILIGMVLVYFVNAAIVRNGDTAWHVDSAWRWMFASEAIPAVVFFLLLFGIPESPRWLVFKGRMTEAGAVLKRFGGEEHSADHIVQIQSSLTGSKRRFSECFSSPTNKVLLVGATLAVLQQLTGINIVMYYAPRIFTSAGLNASAAIGHSIFIGLVMLVFTLFALFLADRAGRRPLLLLSSAGMTLSLVTLGAAYAGGSSGGNSQFLLVSVLVYVAAFSIGMGPLVWTIIGEIFPNRTRAHAASVCVFLLWIANFLVSQFFPYMLSRFEARVFWGYAVICAVTVLFIWRFIPETKGKSLEDIEGNLKTKSN